MNIFVKKLDEKDYLGRVSNYPIFIRKIVIGLKKLINNFFIVNLDDNNKKYILVNIKSKKVYKKVVNQINKEQSKTKKKIQVFISKELKKDRGELKGIKIIDNSKYMIENIENVIYKIVGNMQIQDLELYILANNYSLFNVYMIRNLAKKIKILNVVTNQLDGYKTLENILFEKGIIINVTNNKRKSLKNAKIIINMDFRMEDIKKYNVCRNACIINTDSNAIINNLHGFEGVVINNIKLEFEERQKKLFEEYNLLESFETTELYYSIEKIEKCNVKIDALCGNNGEIDKKELINVQKILTNL